MSFRSSPAAASLLLLAIASMTLAGASGGGYDIPWHSVDAGGGASTGGGYDLQGTIGQTEAAQLTGAGYVMAAGFIPAFTEQTCPADGNGDSVVDVSDLLNLLADWGACPAPCAADVNADGQVDVSDLLDLLAAWGICP